MKKNNRPSHYRKKGRAKEKSTSFYLKRSLIALLKEIAEFERISLNILVERSLIYARGGDYQKANAKRKKKANVFTKKKSKRFYSQNKQKAEKKQKSLFDGKLD